ncbi:MAG TPA: Ig-like domain-containing protein [Verrucomicrobiae bacterium]|nr:Ig-like domain-containing protein [Verrucomicrobiae bacterium]
MNLKHKYLQAAALVFCLGSLATAETTFTVTTSGSPADGGTISGGGSYTSNSTVTVTTNPDSCFEFVKWTVAGKTVTENPYTFTISKNVSLVADFDPADHTITAIPYPSKAGTITGAGKKKCGSRETLKASAKAGFKFVQWIDLANNGEVITNKPSFTFTVDSDRDLEAVFADTQPPTLTVSSPSPGEKVSTPALTISGKVSDNVGVAYIAYSLNGGDWFEVYFGVVDPLQSVIPPEIVVITNGPGPQQIAPLVPPTIEPIHTDAVQSAVSKDYPWLLLVSLKPNSPNTLLVYAADTSGNLSKTNKIIFDCTATGYSPASLSGLIGGVKLTGEPMFDLSFGGDSFGQTDFNTNRGAVGLYNYIQTGSNTAQMDIDYTAPPSRIGNSGPITLSFTDAFNAALSDANGDSGTITFSTAPDTAPSTLSGCTAVFKSETGYTSTNTFSDGVFTGKDSTGLVYSGEYSFIQFSPTVVFTEELITNPVSYSGDSNLIVMTYGSGYQSNTYFITGYRNSGGEPETDYGVFDVTAQTTNKGYAPASLAGLEWKVALKGKPIYSINFGNATFGAASTNTGDAGATVYNYLVTGPNTAELAWSYLSPYNQFPADFPSSSISLTFKKGGTAEYINDITGETGTLTVSHAAALVPASLVGKTAVATFTTNGKKETGKFVFDYGTFTGKSSYTGDASSGTYTYTPVSPTTALVEVTYTDPADLGLVQYLEFNFTTTDSGSLVTLQIDNSTPIAGITPFTLSNSKP